MAKEVRKLLYPTDPYENVTIQKIDNFTWEKDWDIFGEVILFSKPVEQRQMTIVEIGSFLGGSACHMAKILKEQNIDGEIVCIDTWLGSWEHRDVYLNEHEEENRYQLKYKNGRPDLYERFISNVYQKGYQDYITPFPIDSYNGLHYLYKRQVKPDLIYVDGAHDEQMVIIDLQNSQQLLRQGGCILGDDFRSPPIKAAVANVFKPETIHDRDRKFIWIK